MIKPSKIITKSNKNHQLIDLIELSQPDWLLCAAFQKWATNLKSFSLFFFYRWWLILRLILIYFYLFPDRSQIGSSSDGINPSPSNKSTDKEDLRFKFELSTKLAENLSHRILWRRRANKRETDRQTVRDKKEHSIQISTPWLLFFLALSPTKKDSRSFSIIGLEEENKFKKTAATNTSTFISPTHRH